MTTVNKVNKDEIRCFASGQAQSLAEDRRVAIALCYDSLIAMDEFTQLFSVPKDILFNVIVLKGSVAGEQVHIVYQQDGQSRVQCSDNRSSDNRTPKWSTEFQGFVNQILEQKGETCTSTSSMSPSIPLENSVELTSVPTQTDGVDQDIESIVSSDDETGSCSSGLRSEVQQLHEQYHEIQYSLEQLRSERGLSVDEHELSSNNDLEIRLLRLQNLFCHLQNDVHKLLRHNEQQVAEIERLRQELEAFMERFEQSSVRGSLGVENETASRSQEEDSVQPEFSEVPVLNIHSIHQEEHSVPAASSEFLVLDNAANQIAQQTVSFSPEEKQRVKAHYMMTWIDTARVPSVEQRSGIVSIRMQQGAKVQLGGFQDKEIPIFDPQVKDMIFSAPQSSIRGQTLSVPAAFERQAKNLHLKLDSEILMLLERLSKKRGSRPAWVQTLLLKRGAIGAGILYAACRDALKKWVVNVQETKEPTALKKLLLQDSFIDLLMTAKVFVLEPEQKKLINGYIQELRQLYEKMLSTQQA